MALFADLSGLKVLFVTFSNNLIGSGHLNRCLNIADIAIDFGAEIEFLLFGDEAAKSRLTETNILFRHYDSTKIFDLEMASFGIDSPDIIICDVINWRFFECVIIVYHTTDYEVMEPFTGVVMINRNGFDYVEW